MSNKADKETIQSLTEDELALTGYIRQAKNNGMPNHQITLELTNNGWSIASIAAAFQNEYLLRSNKGIVDTRAYTMSENGSNKIFRHRLLPIILGFGGWFILSPVILIVSLLFLLCPLLLLGQSDYPADGLALLIPMLMFMSCTIVLTNIAAFLFLLIRQRWAFLGALTAITANTGVLYVSGQLDEFSWSVPFFIGFLFGG